MDPLPQTGSPVAAAPNVRTWCMLAHLSALVGLFIPMANVVAPLIVWLLKRDQSPEIDEHGKESVNFQISMFIYVVGLSVVTFFLLFIVIGVFLVPVVALLCLADVVFVIIASIKANEGQLYRYPMTIRLVK
jgi:uncharacterized Tic20 family protein